MPARRAGLVLRGKQGLLFIAAQVAKGLVPRQEVSRIPGTELGMALVGGEVVPVLSLGENEDVLVLCDVEGELIAFSGLVPQAAGFFEPTDQGVRYGSERADEINLVGRRDRAERSLTASRRGWLHGAH